LCRLFGRSGVKLAAGRPKKGLKLRLRVMFTPMVRSNSLRLSSPRSREALANVERIAFRLHHNSEQVESPAVSAVRKPTGSETDTRPG
jgi:hypothetical protein